MTWMMPKHSNNPQDWAGLIPIWTSVPTHRDWGDRTRHVDFERFSRAATTTTFTSNTSSAIGHLAKKLSTGLKELDYIQVIDTKAGELTVITRFTQSSFGTSQSIVLGIKDMQKRSWTVSRMTRLPSILVKARWKLPFLSISSGAT